MKNSNVELLAPAGDFEKLQAAVIYGADAVYIGGSSYGLRANAKNFGIPEMAKAISYAHDSGVKVYVTCNIFAHNPDFDGLAEYFTRLEEIGADALIISDPGVFMIARETVPQMDIHISTQANITNAQTAKFWKNQGVKRVVLARELSLEEIKGFTGTDIELEAFCHGAMCISYSGRCLLSSYMTGRDSNRGDCSHPCRYSYNLVEEKRPNEFFPVLEDERGTYIFNSKDLCMLGHIPDMIEAGITSLKIEGRMKSAFYVANTVRAYRRAIDDYNKGVDIYRKNIASYLSDAERPSHREFTTGFYFGNPASNGQIYHTTSYIRGCDFVGSVLSYNETDGFAVVEQRNKFSVDDSLHVLSSDVDDFYFTVSEIYDMQGNRQESAPHPQQIVRVKTGRPLKAFDMLWKDAE